MPIPTAKRLCGAKTRKGEPCKQLAMKNGRCRMHGGKAARGTDHANFKHGRYSKSIPDRLVSSYEQSLKDEERHDLRDEIALSEAKVADLMTGMEHGESDRLWIRLARLERRMQNAPEDKASQILGEMLDLIRRGGQEALAWKDVQEWLSKKQRAVETDVRVAQIKQEMISAEEVMALVAGILDAIRRHVEDQAIRSALARDIRSLGFAGGDGLPVPGPRDSRN